MHRSCMQTFSAPIPGAWLPAHRATMDALPTPSPRRCFPQYLPENALLNIVLRLRNPAELAATCRATAALLDQDDILLDWAAAWSPRLAVHAPIHELRHPSYALLHWRRLRCMDTKRLATLLRRTTPGSAVTLRNAQPMLDAGGDLEGIRRMAPHSQQLLLMYAAQAGHTRLLAELLDPGTDCPVKLHWQGKVAATEHPLVQACTAAVRSGQLGAMPMLLSALQASSRYVPYETLVCTAVAAGARSTGVLQALLALCGRSKVASLAHYWHALDLAVTAGNAAAAAALLAARDGDKRTSFYLSCPDALRSGHIHLLPMLQQADPDIDEEEAAFFICCRAGVCASDAAQQLQLQVLPTAMWRARGSSHHEWAWCCAVTPMIISNNVAALQAVWAQLRGAPERALLAKCMVAALPEAQHADVARWVLSTARPAIHSPEDVAAADASIQQAAFSALSDGHSELLQVLMAPDAAAALVATDQEWQLAAALGKVLSTARSGDVVALNDALSGVQNYMNQHPDLTIEFVDQVYGDALYNALEAGVSSANPATALAIIGVSTMSLSNDDVAITRLANKQLLLAHDGHVVRVLLEQWPAMWAYAAGPASATSLCEQAMQAGDIELAAWLVAHPDQRSDYLSDVQWSDIYSDQPSSNKRTHGLIQLLHRLASMAADGASSTGNGADGREERSSSSSSIGDGSGDGGGGGSSGTSSLPPAGARQLLSEFFDDILSEGNPDLLYALLVFMDSCCSGT